MTNPPFKMALSSNGDTLHAYTWALPDGRTWRAWAPHALRILRKPYRQARTHLELTDDANAAHSSQHPVRPAGSAQYPGGLQPKSIA